MLYKRINYRDLRRKADIYPEDFGTDRVCFMAGSDSVTTLFVLAYEFPPLNVGGVQRPLKFCKYLPECGITPVVFSLDPASYPVVFEEYQIDLATVGDIPADIEVVRVPSDDLICLKKGKLRDFLTTWFSILPREGQGWRKHLIRSFDERVKQHRPQSLLVTAPPFSIIPLGVELAKRHNLPLILDMRDAWSGWNMTPYASYLHYLLTLRLERRCFMAASAIIATSDQTLADFQRLHPSVSKEKFHLITNGYDQEIAEWSAPATTAKEKFVIGYVGSFYYSPEARRQIFTPWWRKRGHRVLQYVPQREDWLYRSPYFFFRAVRRLLDQRPDLASRLVIRFAGAKPEWMDGMVHEFGLDGIVEFLGRISLEESLRFQQTCDALLLTSSKVVGGQDYSIAGKTFEYVSMQKPIIGFVTEGAQKRILERTGMSVICDPDDPNASAMSLERVLDGQRWAMPDETFLDSLHRIPLTEKLARVIDEAVNSDMKL